MEKRRLVRVILLEGLLISIFSSAIVVNLVNANFSPTYLTITLQLPEGNTHPYTENTVPIAFSYAPSEKDFMDIHPESYDFYYGYILDGERIGQGVPLVPYADADGLRANIIGLPNGDHTLIVMIIASAGVGGLPLYYGYSNKVTFTLNYNHPQVSIISPSNKASYVSEVPLTFWVNNETSQIMYSIDGQENVTRYGELANFTLQGLPSGEHNIAIYGWDSLGRVGASQTITFNITKPATETVNETVTKPFSSTFVIAVLIVSGAVVVGLSLIVYFKKRAGVRNR